MSRAKAALLSLLLASCATSSAFRAGEKAEGRRDYDLAVREYLKAVQENPDNAGYQQSLRRARLRAAEGHAALGRRLANRGLLKEAQDELRLALDLSPGSESLAAELERIESYRLQGAPPLSAEQAKQRSRERALEGLELGDAAREPLGLSFRGADVREVYEALGRAAGVNFVFDPQLRAEPIELDLRGVSFDQALGALANVGRTFHKVLDTHVVLVVPDTASKRREHEEQRVKTFFLSNADLKETVDLLRVVLGARRVAPLPGANALTINDLPEKVAAAERIIGTVDKKRAEVVVEVEILEVNRSLLNEYGIQITSAVPGFPGVVGGVFPDPSQDFTLDDNPYSKENLVVTGLPGVIYRLLRTDGSTRLLANPQLRSSEGQAAQAHFGDQVPVPVTVFTPIAQGGISQQPVTSFEYKNVGVNIEITPRVHHDGEISLSLKLDISSVGPPGFQGIPTFSSRTLTSVIRLRDGETNILAGLISDVERESLSGIPWLASVPVLGRLFAHNKTERTQTDIVMTLTPHVVVRPELTEQDLRSFTLGSETAPMLFESPVVPPLPAPDAAPQPPRIEPIRPPLPNPTPAPER